MSAPLLPLALAFALGAALGLEVRAPPWLVPVGLASAGLLLVAGRGRSLVGASPTSTVADCKIADSRRRRRVSARGSVGGLCASLK
jgi:hypothetical protein